MTKHGWISAAVASVTLAAAAPAFSQELHHPMVPPGARAVEPMLPPAPGVDPFASQPELYPYWRGGGDEWREAWRMRRRLELARRARWLRYWYGAQHPYYRGW